MYIENLFVSIEKLKTKTNIAQKTSDIAPSLQFIYCNFGSLWLHESLAC